VAVTIGNSGAEIYEVWSGYANEVEFTPSWSPTGSDKCMVVGVSGLHSGQRTVTSVTRGAETFTEDLDVNYAPPGYSPHTAIFHYLNPGSSGSIVVTYSDYLNSIAIGVVNLNGVDQTTPVDTATSQTGQDSPASITHSADDDDMLICVLGAQIMETGTITPGANQTVIMSYSYTESDGWTHAMSAQEGSYDDVLSYTFPESGDYWLIGAVAFKPAGSAADVTAVVASASADAPAPVVESLVAGSISTTVTL
jgi:hypothetical protein